MLANADAREMVEIDPNGPPRPCIGLGVPGIKLAQAAR